jgi:hypothetical protein
MVLDAATCRYRIGELLGGDAGLGERTDAVTTLREHGITRPERWMTMQLPAPG